MWLVFGGLVIGEAIKRTGLGERVANRISLKFGKTYASIIAGMVTVGLALSFIMPSAVGRIVLLLPIASALSARYGFSEGSQGRTGIILATGLGSFFPAFAILPANVPNVVLTGAAETLYQFSPVYGEYLLLHFPVLGLLKSVAIIAMILLLFPDKPKIKTLNGVQQDAMASDERTLTLLLIITISFWITDFLHHISPAWIALSAGIFCLFPMIGLVPHQSFQTEINYGTLFFLAGVIGLGNMLSYSGLGNKLAKALLAVLPLEPGALLLNFTSISMTGFAIGIVTNMLTVPVVLTPLANEMAKAAALPVEVVLMTQVIGFSAAFLPHQAPPLLVTIQMGGIKAIDLIKICFLLALLTVFILLPIDFLWWRVVGWI
jgi:di/tricarboxylate transporter